MTWSCTMCGMEVNANAASNLVRIGWRITGADTGLCPPCARKGRSDEGQSAVQSELERQVAERSDPASGRRGIEPE